MPTFSINSFFFVGPQPITPGVPAFQRELLVYQLGDNVSGSFGISNPLPPEQAGTDAGAMALYYYNNPSESTSTIEFATLEKFTLLRG